VHQGTVRELRADKDGRDARSPGLLDRRQNAELVVHQHVVLRGEPLRHVVQLSLLVDVDNDSPLDRSAQPGPLDLARLEDDVAVGEDDGRAEPCKVLQHVERAREEAIGEGIVHQEGRNGEQAGIAGIHHPVPLEGTKVVGVAELRPQLLEDLEIVVRAPGTDLAYQVALEVHNDTVVVEQRVVHVQEEDHGMARGHPQAQS